MIFVFLCLTYFTVGPSMLLQMALFHSFLWLSNVVNFKSEDIFNGNYNWAKLIVNIPFLLLLVMCGIPCPFPLG